MRVDPNNPATRVGIAYQMPFTQFDLTVTRVVTGCDQNTITVKVSAEVGPASSAPDPSQSFTIDNNSLTGAFRIGTVKVDYGKNGVPTTFNSSAEDRTAEVVKGVVGFAANASQFFAFRSGRKISLVEPGPAPAVASSVVVPANACSDEVRAAVAEAKAAAAELKTATMVATAADKAYLALKKRVDALGTNVDEQTKKSLVALKEKSDETTAIKDAKKAALDKARGDVTDVEMFSWPPDGSTFATTRTFPDELDGQWTSAGFRGKRVGMGPIVIRLLRAPSGSLAVAPSFLADGKLQQVDPREEPKGIPYRLPAPGWLQVCHENCETKKNYLETSAASILQVGMVYNLPCESVRFTSTSCALSLDASGSPSSIGTEQKGSSAQGLANLAKDVSSQLVAYRKDKTEAELAVITNQTALAKARSDLAKAEAELNADPTNAALQAEIAVNKTYVDYYKSKVDRAAAAAAAANL